MQAALLSFINVLVHSVDDLNFRVFLQVRTTPLFAHLN